MADSKTPEEGKNPNWSALPPELHPGTLGPFAGLEVTHPFDNPVARRAEALKLAVETMRMVREFTNYQVVHVASLYDQFLESGATPPTSEPPASSTDG